MDNRSNFCNTIDVILLRDRKNPGFSRAYFKDTEGFIIGGPNDVIIPAVCYALLEMGYDPEKTAVQFRERIRSKDPHLDQHGPELVGPLVYINESLMRAWETHSALMQEHGFHRCTKVDPDDPLALSPNAPLAKLAPSEASYG